MNLDPGQGWPVDFDPAWFAAAAAASGGGGWPACNAVHVSDSAADARLELAIIWPVEEEEKEREEEHQEQQLLEEEPWPRRSLQGAGRLSLQRLPSDHTSSSQSSFATGRGGDNGTSHPRHSSSDNAAAHVKLPPPAGAALPETPGKRHQQPRNAPDEMAARLELALRRFAAGDRKLRKVHDHRYGRSSNPEAIR